jgi:hypothetical protein
MVKATKYFLKQAEKAERSAVAADGDRASVQLLDLAGAYRAQAAALKKKPKKPKKT